MRMRAFAILLVGLAACPDGGPGPGPGPGSNPPPGGAYCDATTPCGNGQECARDDECVSPDQARSVMTHWTIAGQPADATSCAPVIQTGRLTIEYSVNGTGEYTGFAPLMCDQGQFFVDVWPVRFDHVRVFAANTTNQYLGEADLGAGNAEVTVDLQFK